MESIAELRSICQSTAQRDRSNVYMRYVSRFFSIYFTRLLLPTKVTANQVSFAMIVTGVVSALFFLSPSKWLFLGGAILLQCWYILDCMDGEVARYRHRQESGASMKKESALSGMYYDIINHYIVHLLVPATLGLGLFYGTGHSFFMGLGIVGTMGQVLMLAMIDARKRAIMTYLVEYSRIEVIRPEEKPQAAAKKTRNLAQTVFMTLHYTMTYPTVMNLMLLCAILDLVCSSIPWRIIGLSYLAIGSTCVAFTIVGRTIAQQLLEKECQSQFRVWP